MTQSFRQIEAAIAAHYPNIHEVYVTSTTGGTHAVGSYHYRGMAVDYGAATQAAKDRLGAWLYQYSEYILELIHTKAAGGGWYVKNGTKGYPYSSSLKREHINHVHVAMSLEGVSGMLLTFEPVGSPVLRLGDTGAAVKTLQQILNAKGAIPHLVVDASFGPATKAAVVHFQTLSKLVPDGVVGPHTWDALRAS